ncbi:hypothetical protein HK414_00315 [Ramlibacter terrae]|uniref:DUF3617 family protein n=1 Tax=Ramlibacter terrae TaxID=2732511 RepID=A0ABX6NZM7_9BURK|nr:hypothetical protein HK414_00315 [Ramlibacter terrae]
MIPHHPTHWIAVAAAASLALLAFEVAGQSTGSQAVFEGRPAMAGARAGLGAMAGPPQGGIGLQGTDGAQVNLRRPDTTTMGAGRALPTSQCEGPTVSAAQNPACLTQVGDERIEGRMARLGISDPQQR